MKNKFEIKNFLDQRYRSNKDFQRWFNKYTLAALVDGIILGSLVGLFIADNPYKEVKLDSPSGVKQTIEVKAVDNTPQRYCDSPIDYIRCSGEDLGKSNKEISVMINIAKCESGYREDAINVNTNKTIDRGIFQLNSIHKDISNADAFTFKSNIDYAWKMFTRQGTTPWDSSKHCWNK